MSFVSQNWGNLFSGNSFLSPQRNNSRNQRLFDLYFLESKADLKLSTHWKIELEEIKYRINKI